MPQRYYNMPRLTRREMLRVGGISIAGGFLNSFRPLNVMASQKVKPLVTARQVIVIMLDGGLSQVDSFDAKEGAWTPPDLDIRSFGNGVRMPAGIFKILPTVLDRVTVVRSLNAWDAVHGRAQYYLQTGHPLNLALAKEVPAVGAVVGYELSRSRKSEDSLPPFVAMNAISSQAGLITQGFLSAEFGPIGLAVTNAPLDISPGNDANGDFHRRWDLLQELDRSLRRADSGYGRGFADYHDYYRGAYAIMNDARVPEIFKLTDEEKRRYGNSALGNVLLLARNLIRADAGTRFVLAGHPGWDHHTDIYRGKRSHIVLMRELDVAYTNLIRDLAATSSKHEPSRSLLDETLVVCMGEFGRTPGPITESRLGREHYIHSACALFAGGGVRGGNVIGKTDDLGAKVIDPGWSAGRPIYMEDVACTIYSALGIDWTKTIQNTPSGRAFHYIEPSSGTRYVGFQPVTELFS